MNDRVEELLSRITELSDDELQELADLVRAEFDRQAGPPPDFRVDNVAMEELESLAGAATAVKQERKRRDENVTRAQEAQRVLASFAGDDGRATVPADRRPRFTGAGTARALTASGLPVPDRDGLAREFVTALRNSRAPNAQDGRVLVATLHADRPEGRTLRQQDSAEAVTAALEAAAHEHQAQAITAAGGLAAPEQPDYVLPGFEVTTRPVKSSLPTFTAARGGVRYIRPPSLTDLRDAVGIWDVADDVAAVTDPEVRKPSLRVTAGNEIVVDVQAVTSILTFGNMTHRAYPEFVTRVIDLATAAHARIAEQQLLTQIGSLSTPVSGAAVATLGATRVLLPILDRAATGMRDRLRTAQDAPLQLILPHWARGILRSDLALQEPGDSRVGTTDADLAAYLAAQFLRPTWALDGETGQQFNPQAPGAVNDWPSAILCYLFPAGAFQFLDGGTLDLGLVRDSELNAANDFQTFTETFETAIFRGGEALRISQAVTPSGLARAAAAA